MPTETEIKIHITNKSDVQKIINDEYITRFVQDGFQVENMHALYYDTPDWDLCKEGFMLRMRSNGSRVIVSLKQGFVDKDHFPGLCIRRKWVCTTPEIDTAIDCLLNSGAPERLSDITQGKSLQVSAEARFTRTSAVLYMPEGLRVELAMDDGELIAGGRTAPINEMEFEVLFGNIYALRPFCDGLAERYDFSPELYTKHEKAFALASEA